MSAFPASGPTDGSSDVQQRSQLLSNGRYSVMLLADGSGFSRWQGLGLTRWREGGGTGPGGLHLLLRDEENGARWSTTAAADEPGGSPVDADFAMGRAVYTRRVGDIESRVEITVAPDADLESRSICLRNLGERPRALSLTAYAEAVVGPLGPDDTHPAFSKMFVQTEWAAEPGLLLATRRRRAATEPALWIACALRIEGDAAGAGTGADGFAFETDRRRFLGRGRSLATAQAMAPGASLSNTTGCVLDPLLALRRDFAVAPGASIRLAFWMSAASSREGAIALANRFGERLADPGALAALTEAAVRHAVAENARLAIAPADGARYDDWLAPLLVGGPRTRLPPEQLSRARGGPPTLWAAGISGDRPIALALLRSPADLDTARDLLRAQDLWRSRRFGVDVVLLDTARGVAGEVLYAALEPLAAAQRARLAADASATPVSVFTLRAESIDGNLRDALLAVARLVLGRGVSPEPAGPTTASTTPAVVTRRATRPAGPVTPGFLTADPTAEFDNGFGAFIDGGRAYRIDLSAERCTPAPWINVIANPQFGCFVSAEGGGHTWSINSQQNPLTPWPNDAVTDAPQETIYLRDAESDAVWSATAAPIRVMGARYAAIHGKGWTRFETDAHGIDLELTVFVAPDDPVKVSWLRLANRAERTRRLNVSGVVNWALGANGTAPAAFVVTSRDDASGALFARNAWRPEFADRVAFLDFGDASQAVAGEHGDTARPAGLPGTMPLADSAGAGRAPCGAVRTQVELPPGTRLDLTLLLGDAPGEAEARALVERFRATNAEALLQSVEAQWREVLDTVQVTTPDRALDVMLNHWLPYQVLGCRVWARTAYYQASGAYGFRDQLQDVMALCISRPDLAREHLLRAAGRQFAEGDVQHWWLPPGGQGVRTRISDDRVWLVHVAVRYADVTGDAAVWDVELPFLTGPAIEGEAADAFFQPGASSDTASLYAHCALALDASLGVGMHGLPLIHTGDWNDGFNRVGEQGKGESVWLGWLLLKAIRDFAPVATGRGEAARAAKWQEAAARLQSALDDAWDGTWYRRGYYDDGTPLGSAGSDECRIDTIAQSWSVIAADPAAPPSTRSREAMASVDRLLVDPVHRVSKLFTPPFDRHSRQDPGYIKGYPPGVRENGGQYTHGAAWTVFAWAGLGDTARAHAAFDLLNPIRHAASREAAERYRVEPYVVAADVYAEPPHVGLGGWTWYTGSAAWLHRAGLEAVLGFQLAGDQLRIAPCIPSDWPGFDIVYRRRTPGGPDTVFEIRVDNLATGGSANGAAAWIEFDGRRIDAGAPIPLPHDFATHRIHVQLG